MSDERKPFWVEDIRDAWKWLSMWVQGTGASVMGAFLLLEPEQRQHIFGAFGMSAEQGVTITAFLTFLVGMLARVKNQ